jgi:hypothetical protein
LAAHTSANWEGVKVSERGRVSMGALRDGLVQVKWIQEDGALPADQFETGLEAGKFGGELAGGWQTQEEMQKIAGT